MGHGSTLRVPAAKGLMLKEGRAIDARLAAAPPSIKNGTGTRDPEMHQATSGNGATNFGGVHAPLCRPRG